MRPPSEDDRTINEIMNGLRGPEPWRERQYGSDPEYEAVKPELFDYLERIQVRLDYVALEGVDGGVVYTTSPEFYESAKDASIVDASRIYYHDVDRISLTSSPYGVKVALSDSIYWVPMSRVIEYARHILEEDE